MKKSLKVFSILVLAVLVCVFFYKVGYTHKGKKCNWLIKANYSYGKEDGEKEGRDEGYSEGYSDGKEEGYNEGYWDGKSDGEWDGKRSCE